MVMLMKRIAEYKSDQLIFNHLIYDKETERHFAKHSHSMFELIYVAKGEVSYVVEDSKFTANQGELIIINPYSYHYFTIRNRQDYEKIGILFSPALFDLGNTAQESFSVLDCSYGRIHDTFQKLDFYYHNCQTEVFAELLTALTKELTINIKHFGNQYKITSEKESVHPLVKRAIDYINDNLFSLNTVKELAERLSVSESHLKVLFRNQLKVTPKNYITEKKMLLARSMLYGGTSPTQVAISLGYQNYVTFYRVYLKHFETRPTDDYKNTK